MNRENYILIYLVVVNLIAFVAFMIDKLNAMHERRRIRETTLIGLALIGGSAGAYLSMGVFNHKTRKLKFAIGIPVIILLQISIYLYSQYRIIFFD